MQKMYDYCLLPFLLQWYFFLQLFSEITHQRVHCCDLMMVLFSFFLLTRLEFLCKVLFCLSVYPRWLLLLDDASAGNIKCVSLCVEKSNFDKRAKDLTTAIFLVLCDIKLNILKILECWSDKRSILMTLFLEEFYTQTD